MNKVMLLGRLTKEPEVRYAQGKDGNFCIARYTLAVDRYKSDADFINCQALGKNGEFAEKYLHKGMKIAIEGNIKTGSYEKDGIKHYTTDVIVDRHEFCDSKNGNGEQPTSENPIADAWMKIPENCDDDIPFV